MEQPKAARAGEVTVHMNSNHMSLFACQLEIEFVMLVPVVAGLYLSHPRHVSFLSLSPTMIPAAGCSF
jgi:hypothetical protein